jgi:AraC-type DNA-binding domain-containing proteins
VNEYNYIVQVLSRMYKAVGNNERTIEFLERQTEQQANLLQKRQDQVVDDLKNQYELELKEKELANAQLAALSQRRTMMSAIFILFLVSVGGVFFFFKRNQSLRVLYERNLELLNQFYVPSEDVNPVEEDASDPLKNIFVRIKKAMEEDKLFRQHDLSISVLASHISSNDKYTSNAISAYTKMNFNRFLNFHRINEAKRLLLQYGKDAVVSDVLEECGYASRSTFYKAFGEFTGMTPKEFISLSRRNEDS